MPIILKMIYVKISAALRGLRGKRLFLSGQSSPRWIDVQLTYVRPTRGIKNDDKLIEWTSKAEVKQLVSSAGGIIVAGMQSRPV